MGFVHYSKGTKKPLMTEQNANMLFHFVSFFFSGKGLARISLLLGNEITKFDTVSSKKRLNQQLKPLYMANETRKDSLPCTGLNSAGQTFIDALYSRLEPNNH